MAGLAAAAAMLAPAPAWAAAPAYGDWTVSGSGSSWTGTLDVAVAGFPHADLATDSLTPATPSGGNTYLGAQTPVGTAFGSSQGRPYLTFRATTGGAPSTTTLTFDSPTHAGGWAFVLGDIDADSTVITATGADGAPVPASALGFQGAFNYCVNTPKPPACTGPGPFTDMPTWDEATGTLMGNSDDTAGAAGWFMPTVPLRAITFTFSVLEGYPIAQLWVVAAPAAPPVVPPVSAANVALSLPVTGGGSAGIAIGLLVIGAVLVRATRRRC